MNNTKIEERSEEVHDIIERMPTRWTIWVALFVSILMSVIILLSFLIQYPDTVNGEISITASKAPVRLVSGVAGRIHLLQVNRSKQKEGNVIAYIENGADYASIKQLEKLIQQGMNLKTVLRLPTHSLLLGDLSSTYNNFILSYQQYDQLRQSPIHTTMQKTLHQQVEADTRVAANIEKELQLKGEVVTNLKNRLKKDSLLMDKGGISEADYNNQCNTYLGQNEANVSLQSSHLSKLSDINKNRLEAARVSIEETEALQKAYIDVIAKRNELINALRQWKEHYLLISPIEGDLEYLGFWRENTYIQTGQELFAILPTQNDIVGEVRISSKGAGKVKIGQEANVKLNDFPYDEYGVLKGKVRSVAKQTNEIKTSEGTIETYLVVVSFPNGLLTSFDKRLSLNFETKGIIEIITKPKRLIQRLFDNLKAKETK